MALYQEHVLGNFFLNGNLNPCIIVFCELSYLTCASGLQLPSGGSGGIGAPSRIKEQYSTGMSGIWLDIIFPVSVALVIVE